MLLINRKILININYFCGFIKNNFGGKNYSNKNFIFLKLKKKQW